MQSPTRVMLEDLFTLFSTRFIDKGQAWDNFLKFLSFDRSPTLFAQLQEHLPLFLTDDTFRDELARTYKPELLCLDYEDHLGAMYEEYGITEHSPTKSGCLTDNQINASLSQIPQPDIKRRITIFDPAASSGRVLLAVHRKLPDAILFGIDADLNLLKIAMTNFAIHSVRGYLLHADIQQHHTDISTDDGRYNWQFANRWESHQHDLKELPRATP